MGTLYLGGIVFTIDQPSHKNSNPPIDPEFKFAWTLGEEYITGMRTWLLLPFSSPGSFNLTLSATVVHRPRGNTKEPRPTENPYRWFP